MRSKMHRNLFCTAVDENMRIVSHDATIFLCEDYALNTLEEKKTILHYPNAIEH